MFRMTKLLWRFRKPLLMLLVAATSMAGPRGTVADKAAPLHRSNLGGRERADSPADLSQQGWKAALLRTKEALKDKDLSTSAAALSYYTTLSFFPVVIGLATVYVLFTNTASLLHVVHGLQNVLPALIYTMLNQQLGRIAHSSGGAVGVAAALSILTLLWTTSGGLQHLIKALNKAYGVEESRGKVKLRLTSIGLSVFVLLAVALILILLTLQANALTHWGWPSWLAAPFPFVRWPLLIILVAGLLSTLYRYAPNRQQPRWQWVSWGGTAATIIWLIATVAFFIYAQNFANFNKTYGVFAAIIVLMSWFNISGLVILLGAQVNQKLEAVTANSTKERPHQR